MTGKTVGRRSQGGGKDSNWVVALGWICFGIYATLSVHKWVLGPAAVAVGAAYAWDEILSRNAPAKWRLNTVRCLAALVGAMIVVNRLFPPGT